MFRLITILLLVSTCALPVARAETTAAPTSAADQAYEAMFAAWHAEPPTGLGKREQLEFMDRKFQAFSAAVRAFGQAYPHDPRRYNGYVQSSFTSPQFITGFKPEFDADPRLANAIIDERARAAFLATQARLLTEVVEAPDASTRQRGGAFFALLAGAREEARIAGRPFDVRVVRPVVANVLAKLGDERVIPVVEQYLPALKEQDAAAAATFAAGLQEKPAVAAAFKAEEAKRAAEEAKLAAAAKVRDVEIARMKFTAADGREVDLAALKGKVVLVDFWATWCGPCKEEIPNVVANYNKYHDQGFEVVGVTLENPGIRPGDTEAQKAAKLAAAKEKMLAFTNAHHMPWPQYFDGKWWKNDYVVKFGITAIPAMFLLDQEGHIVSTEARGPKLESEIKRLLGR